MATTISENLGVGKERAEELSKIAFELTVLHLVDGASESNFIKALGELEGLTPMEKVWVAYKVGGYPSSKEAKE